MNNSKWKPNAFWNSAGKMFEVFWEITDYYGEWIGGAADVTLFKADWDDRVVGISFVPRETVTENERSAAYRAPGHGAAGILLEEILSNERKCQGKSVDKLQ